MTRAFVIRPFGTKTDSTGKEINFEQIHQELIDPALKAAQFEGGTTGEIIDSGNIREDMFALILEADLVVCDITVQNANVFYELGIRHALRKKRTLMIRGTPTNDSTPFDLLTDRYLAYDIANPAAAKNDLTASIAAAMRSERPTDSPIFQMLPSLLEADPSRIKVVPFDFREEVGRAQTSRALGWLRLLSEEVRGRRFQWEGLKIVATAQWELQDYEGAIESWEAIRRIYPKDISANLALANIYERQYRKTMQPEIFEASERAISRVIDNSLASPKQRAEALALKGRNQKTRWRLEIDAPETIEERRKAAMNRALIRSYEAYQEAFLVDLNHFYPGLNALQMGTILLDLAGEDAWYDAFDSDHEADNYREKITKEIAALRSLIPISVEAGLSRMPDGNPERIWAEISKADMLFLTDTRRETRVIGAYRDAIPKDKPFAWDAARGQLKLFADLNVQPDLANKIIADINERFTSRAPDNQGKPVHLLLFAGHRVDTPGRSDRRFPVDQENRARALIYEAVNSLLDDAHEVIGLASAAPGTDILAHEVCDELGLASTICLPMPNEVFARFAFHNLDTWRSRFLDLQNKHAVLVLSDREGLPRWLADSGVDSWERGNQWVMKMALTSGANRITLIALWDGKAAGDAPGGTAHMIRLAEEAGRVHIHRIDSMQLVI
jgi:hypothetical protein